MNLSGWINPEPPGKFSELLDWKKVKIHVIKIILSVIKHYNVYKVFDSKLALILGQLNSETTNETLLHAGNVTILYYW